MIVQPTDCVDRLAQDVTQGNHTVSFVKLHSNQHAVTHWLLIGMSPALILVALVPLDLLLRIGIWISPLGTLQEKTILLFQMLKTVLPILGLVGLGWLFMPPGARHWVFVRVNRIVDSKWTVPGILLLAWLVRSAWVSLFPSGLYADSEWYFEKGSQLANGLGYIYDLTSRRPTAVWPVGYPAFLALIFLFTGPSIFVAKYINIILGTLIVALTYSSAKRIFHQRVAVFAAFFMATLPGIIVYSSLVASELLFLALFLLVFRLALMKELPWRFSTPGSILSMILVGLVNGAMVLTRSTGLALLPFWIAIRWLAIRRNELRRIAILRWGFWFVVGTCALLIPWTIRNYIDFQRVILVSTNGGLNFWMGNNPLAYGGFIFPENEAQNPLLPIITDEIATDQMGYKLGFDFIQSDPMQALRILPAKIFYLYNSNDFGLDWNWSSASGSKYGVGFLAHAYTNMIYTIYGLLAILGFLLLLFAKTRQPLVWIGVAFAFYWTLVHLPFFGQDRFALPVLPFLGMYAGYGFFAILDYGAPVLHEPSVRL